MCIRERKHTERTEVKGTKHKFPEFIRTDHPVFVEFLRLYYQFLETAKITLSSVQAQDNVLYSKLNYATLSSTYHQYVIQYQALTDELLTNYSITL